MSQQRIRTIVDIPLLLLRKAEEKLMKPLLCMILFLFAISLPCFGELTENDIRQIRQVIREELEPIKIEIATIKGDIKVLETRITELDNRMTEKFKAVEDKISLIQWFIGLLVAIVVAAIAIPQLLILYREKKESKEIDELKDIIVELKGKKVIMP
ncbi:hypothetical protein FJZ31_41815 [Candidatus Poribacteria bacterium]|nr:hypothetical protein [Candidatus Poribacteria bacterium]